MRKLWVVVAAVAILGAVSVAPAWAASGHKVNGTVLAEPIVKAQPLCAEGETVSQCLDHTVAKYGTGGLPNDAGKPCLADAVSAGDQVVVRNESGKTIAVADIGDGVYTDSDTCIFKFTVKVPDASFYSFGLPGHGKVTYSKSKLSHAGWKVPLSL